MKYLCTLYCRGACLGGGYNDVFQVTQGIGSLPGRPRVPLIRPAGAPPKSQVPSPKSMSQTWHLQ